MRVLPCFFCGGFSVTSIFKAFILVFRCAPGTCATQGLVSRHWVYTGFSSQSLCSAPWGLFHEGTIPEVIPRLKLVRTWNEGIFSGSLWVSPILCPDLRASFFFSFFCFSGQKICFFPGFAFRVKWQERREKNAYCLSLYFWIIRAPFPGSSFWRWFLCWGLGAVWQQWLPSKA